MSNLITEDIPTVAILTATPGQTVFSTDFPIFEDTDLHVSVDGVTATEYAVTDILQESGATVTFDEAMTGGEEVLIYRTVPIQRAVDLPATGPYSSDDIDLEFDRAFAIMQELDDKFDRVMLAPPGETLTPLPAAADRALTFFTFGPDGDILLLTYEQVALLVGTGGDADAAQVIIDLSETITSLTQRIVALEAVPAWSYRYGGFAATNPEITANLVLMAALIDTAHTLTEDFFDCLDVECTTNPASTWIAKVKKNDVDVGTVTISTGGVVTLATSAAADLAVAEGDVMKLVAPAVADTTLAGLTFTFRGIVG